MMEQQKGLVSIVIPVYNGANYMREAIDSALAQTYPHCEVIVVDDGSTDGGETQRIAQSYGNRIRFFHKENGGVATAVNYGIRQMRGEYYAWLSHDDKYFPDKIERQVNAIEAAEDDVEIVHGNFDFLNMEREKQDHVDWLRIYSREELERGNFSPLFLCVHGSTVLIRRSCFERVGLYREDLPTTQDSEFLVRAMQGHRSIFLSGEPLIVARLHAEQGQKTMGEYPAEFNKMFIEFCEQVPEADKISMCGSVYNFYYRFWLTMGVIHASAKGILDYLQQKMKGIGCKNPDERAQKNVVLQHEFQQGNRKKSSKIYLFGCGMYGKYLHHDLQAHGIHVDGFIDNDPQKQGTRILGTLCYRLEDVRKDREHAIVIVSMLAGDEVLKQLQGAGFRSVYSLYDCREKLAVCEPVLGWENLV